MMRRRMTVIAATIVLLAHGTATIADTDGGGVSPSQEAGARLEAVRTNEFFYQSYGKNDPFRQLVDGRYEQVGGGEFADLNSAKLVGVMWADDDQFALVEDGGGFGYILRVGDRVLNGRVVSIHRNRLTARLTLYGITNTVVLKLENAEAK